MSRRFLRARPVFDRRIPRAPRPACSVGWALVFLIIAIFVFFGLFRLIFTQLYSLSYRNSKETMASSSDSSSVPAYKTFWSEKQRMAMKVGELEEAEERKEQLAQLQKLHEESRRLVERTQYRFLDANTQNVVSQEFIEKMGKEIGSPVNRIMVVAENGRDCSDDKYFESAIYVVQAALSKVLGPAMEHCFQDGELVHAFLENSTVESPISYEGIPLMIASREHVVTLDLDLEASDEEAYIRPNDKDRLFSKYGFSTEQFERVQQMAISKVRHARFYKMRKVLLDLYVLPEEQSKNLDALRIIKLLDKTRIIPLRIRFPHNASELLAQQAILFALDRILGLFDHVDRDTPFEKIDETFRWLFKWGVRVNHLTDDSKEVLLVLGKQESSPQLRKVRKRELESLRKLQEASQHALEKKIASKAENGIKENEEVAAKAGEATEVGDDDDRKATDEDNK